MSLGATPRGGAVILTCSGREESDSWREIFYKGGGKTVLCFPKE
jgi:hypothetical protein